MRVGQALAPFLVVAIGLVPGPLDGQEALDELIAASQAAHSDALFVMKGGEVLLDWSAAEPQPIEVMSALKSVVAIAVGRLLQDGLLDSLDQPVHSWYPEWKQGRKRNITIRHLMNHTSGLQNVLNAGEEIYPAPNAIQLALAAELSDDPGARFAYNNKAVNLLAGVIERASGRRMDLYIQERVFGPLGIDRYQWYFDRSGSPHAMAGLRLLARDLAKFGELVLSGGERGGERIVPEGFLDAMLRPGQAHYPLSGLLWWLYPAHQSVRIRPGALDSLGALAARRNQISELADRSFPSRDAARSAFAAAWSGDPAAELGPTWFDRVFEWQVGPTAAYYADGYLGQYLVVVPAHAVVAVRQVKRSASYDPESDGFAGFPALIAELAPRLAARR